MTIVASILFNFAFIAVDGMVGPWLRGDCSVTCGVGEEIQTRVCNNPPPLFGGTDCPDILTQTVTCYRPHCPSKFLKK